MQLTTSVGIAAAAILAATDLVASTAQQFKGEYYIQNAIGGKIGNTMSVSGEGDGWSKDNMHMGLAPGACPWGCTFHPELL